MYTAKLLIVRGLPGSGKSTFAASLTDRVHFETDMYFSQTGVYLFEGTKLPQAHRWCQAKVHEALASGKKVVVSNTFTRLWEMEEYRKMTDDFQVVRLLSQFDNIHGVPAESIDKMKTRWENCAGEQLLLNWSKP